MKHSDLLYVMPISEIWLVRRSATRADAYPSREDAVAAALAEAHDPSRIRVVERATSGRDERP